MELRIQAVLPPLLILLVAGALYGCFLSNPVVFDDIKFFQDGTLERIVAHFNFFGLRQVAYVTLALSWTWIGHSMLPMRIVSLLLHASVGISLYLFLRDVQRICSPAITNKPDAQLAWLPLLGALVFVVHPVAVYGAAYLIERTIVMATLFALWSWICALKALQYEQKRWAWGSVVFYLLSGLSKEHAVMVPLVSLALGVWWYRTQSRKPNWKELLIRFWQPGVCILTIALYLLIMRRGFVGDAYEGDIQTMRADAIPEPAWLLSVLTQGYLFFKYLLLWALPNPLWMSADMREPFAPTVTSMPQVFGGVLFLAWLIAGVVLLWRGGRRGLLGFAMLAPAVLFATELVSVRYYEIFVLYRSYLWLPPAFVVILLLEDRVSTSLAILLTILVPIILAPLAWNRLMTFSHPFYLWNDAVRLANGKTGVSGMDRILVDRGVELHRLKRYDLAIKDYTVALTYNPDFSPAYGGRASALAESGRELAALPDFDAAIRLQPKFPIYRANKAKALEALGRYGEAADSFQAACDLGWKIWCDTAQEMRRKASDQIVDNAQAP